MARYNEQRAIDDVRLLALDMIKEAGSGHPGVVLGAAPTLYTLFMKHMNYDLERRDWTNRDRFVLSAGHASALLYAIGFYLTDDYSLVDLHNFRRLDSLTPGHPEYNLKTRVEVTTGALGQGIATAVGMAIAEKNLEETYNIEGKKGAYLFDYFVYAFCSDGDMMEGVTYEAASLAGTLNLDNLIIIYDKNDITIDGSTDKTFTEDVSTRFAAMGFDVFEVNDGEKVKEIDKAIISAQKSEKPSLIIVNSIIGIYSKYENTNKIHSKLDDNDLEEIRDELGGEKSFSYDKSNMILARNNLKRRLSSEYSEWYHEYENFCKIADSKKQEDLNNIINNEKIVLQLDKVIDMSKLFIDKALVDVNYQIMNVIAAFIPQFIGGTADVLNSTKTYLKGKGDYSIDNYTGKNIFYGVREHAMGAISNGLALSNFRPFASTFLVFSDYLKPAIRNSCIMRIPVTYIFSHDTFLIGQDGVTHQPIEQLGSLRMIPGLDVYRPCDYKELIGSWNLILKNANPAALVLTKFHTKQVENSSYDAVKYGAYIISEVKESLDLIIIATGSEVPLALKVKEELLRNYIDARVVSMPNVNLFLEQDSNYRKQILPSGYKIVVIEFSNDPIFYQFVKDKSEIININHFGKSGKTDELAQDFSLDIASIVIKIKNML